MKRTLVRHIPAYAGMLLVVCLVLGVTAAPALAAVTWSNQTPASGAVITATNPTISVKASDPAGISWATRSAKLDGVRKTPTYNASTGVLSLATSGLSYGTHTVYFSVNNVSGQASSTTWTFTIAGKPTITTLAPADGSIQTTDRPTISAVVDPNVGTLAAWTMKVDGTAVTATYNTGAKLLAYVPSKKLANDAIHTVSLDCTNSAGFVTSLSWSFSVQIYADMADTAGCTDCHTTFPEAHPMTNCPACHGPNSPIGEGWNTPEYSAHSPMPYLGDCVGCHGSVYPVPRHGDVSASHITVANMTGCACHVRSLTIEHNRWTDEAGNPIACTSCHGPNVPQRVKDALAAGSTNCLDCHESANHESLHTVSLEPDCVGCHQGSSLTSIHITNGHQTCDTCHKSTDQKVIDAIANGDVSCGACHGAQHALDKTFCYGCHQTSYYTYNGQGVADQNKHMTVTSSTKALASWPGTTLPAASCANCHDDHSGGTRAAGNALCETCHDAAGTTKPTTYSYQGASVYATAGHKDVGGDSRREFVLRSDSTGFSAWEGTTEPTPASPGTPMSAAKVSGLLTKDGNRAITASSTTNGGYDYQMYRFKVPAESTAPMVTVRWAGFGEETPNYPVTLTVWNRTLNGGAGGWETLQSSQIANLTALQFNVSTAAHLDSDGYLYVMAKAKNVIDTTLVSGPTMVRLSATGMRLDWTTLGLADGYVDWGATSAYGQTFGSATRTTGHSITLSGTKNATYHYRARSTGRDGDYWTTGDKTVAFASPTSTPVGDVASDYPVAINFGWTVPVGAGSSMVYRVHVWAPYGSYQYMSSWSPLTSLTLANVPLDYYYWQVEAMDLATGTTYLPSAIDDFSVYSPSSTCPYLFTWDGDTYNFETDLYGQGKLAIPRATGFAKPEPHEAYVLQHDPAEKDGYLDFRMVEERSETDYMDEWAVYSADVPDGYDLYTERPAQGGAGYSGVAGEVHTARTDAPAPVSATWVNTGQSVRDLISASDQQRLLLNEDRNSGFTYQTLELDLGSIQSAPQVKLLVDAQTMFPNNADGYARAATFSYTSKLEVQDGTGAWVSVPSTAVALPRPAEFYRPMAIDISNIWRSDSRKIRLTFLFKTYVDSIRVDTSADVDVNLTKLALHDASLRPHGKDGVTSGGDFYEYLYGQPNDWTFYFPGNYTRFGDVKALLATGNDDKYVIFGGGDEITARFEPAAQAAAGTTRKYVTLVDGWYKDPKSACDKTVEPLPFHAQSTYPYATSESYPTDAEHTAYLAEYNTRYESGTETTETAQAATGSLFDQLAAWVEGVWDAAKDSVVALFGDAPSTQVASAKLALHYSVDTDKISLRVTNASGTQTSLPATDGWESVGATPTPSVPGTQAVAATLAKTATQDSQYWITNLASVDKTKNWQLFEVALDPTLASSAKDVAAFWTGHGEPTPGYPTTLYIWNFVTNSWDQKASGQAATDLTFSLDEPKLSNTFCLKCHDAAAPTGVTVPSTMANISTAWGTTGNDAHGSRAGTRAQYLKPEYAKGSAAIPCSTCHETHGNNNLYHLQTSINGKNAISVVTNAQAEAACTACHTGNADQWHQWCNDCHFAPDAHEPAPVMGSGTDCLSCHRHGKTWTHPASCHCGPYPDTFNNF